MIARRCQQADACVCVGQNHKHGHGGVEGVSKEVCCSVLGCQNRSRGSRQLC